MNCHAIVVFVCTNWCVLCRRPSVIPLMDLILLAEIVCAAVHVVH
jgi:hypothetical protein